MKDFAQIAVLDKYGFPLNPPIPVEEPGSNPVPWKQGVQQTIQTNRIKASSIAIGEFVKLSRTAIGLGTIANGAAAALSSSLTPQSPHATDPNFAVAFVGVFVGTSTASYNSANQIYPTIGGSQTAGSWDIRGDYDYNGVGGTLSGTTSTWNGYVINNSGATGTIQFVTRWKYIDFNNGTVS